MARSPFTVADVATAGVWPGRVRDTPPGLRRYWLGKPGRMIQLPAPKVGRETTASSGESVHVSAGGVTSVFRRAGAPKRRFVLAWDRLTGRDWDLVNGFYRRIIVGPGPWVYFPPEDVNRLDEAVSLCSGASRWTTTGGTVTVDDTVTAPLDPSRALRWAGAGAGQQLATPPVVNLPAEPVTVSVWLWASTGTRQARVAVGDRQLDVTLTTTPTRVVLSAPADVRAAGDQLTPTVTLLNAGADVFVAAPQLEYAAAATDWSLGAGVPRVVWTDPPGRQLDARLRSATTMTLTE